MTILPVKLTNDDTVIPLSRIAIIDLEASGLGSAGFPTEIGWAILHDDGTVTSGACLIRPAAKWTTYSNAWSPASERLTGISRPMLDQDGLSPRDAVNRFLEAVGDRDLLSDEPDFDTHWLDMLMDAARGSHGKLGDLGFADRIKVECGACKHVGLIAAAGLGLPPHTAVLDLKDWLRCQGCGAKGKAIVSVGRTPQHKVAGIVDKRAYVPSIREGAAMKTTHTPVLDIGYQESSRVDGGLVARTSRASICADIGS